MQKDLTYVFSQTISFVLFTLSYCSIALDSSFSPNGPTLANIQSGGQLEIGPRRISGWSLSGVRMTDRPLFGFPVLSDAL
jgi:hypothetical protein